MLEEPLPEGEELLLLFRTALPIDNVDTLSYPGAHTAIVWVDLSDRTDLQVLTQQGDLNKDKLFICTWFYADPGTQKMKIGLRIKMHSEPHLIFSLVFPVERFYDQLMTLSLEGSLWVVPGPPPTLFGTISGHDIEGFFHRVAVRSGQGLWVTLSPEMVEELQKQLRSWPGQSRSRLRANPPGGKRPKSKK